MVRGARISVVFVVGFTGSLAFIHNDAIAAECDGTSPVVVPNPGKCMKHSHLCKWWSPSSGCCCDTGFALRDIIVALRGSNATALMCAPCHAKPDVMDEASDWIRANLYYLLYFVLLPYIWRASQEFIKIEAKQRLNPYVKRYFGFSLDDYITGLKGGRVPLQKEIIVVFHCVGILT